MGLRRPFLGAMFCAISSVGCAANSSRLCQSCAEAQLHNHWCEPCKVGYVAGVPIRSHKLFECLDAHGHDLDLSAVTCPVCKSAIKSDGFCDECRRGWVRGQAYYSRLTYHIGKGRQVGAATLQCAVCRRHSTRYGWCAACKRGIVGNVVILDRADYDDACKGFDLMMAAIDVSRRCEHCAMAVMTDSMCPFCKITYKAGRRVDSHPLR